MLNIFDKELLQNPDSILIVVLVVVCYPHLATSMLLVV